MGMQERTLKTKNTLTFPAANAGNSGPCFLSAITHQHIQRWICTPAWPLAAINPIGGVVQSKHNMFVSTSQICLLLKLNA